MPQDVFVLVKGSQVRSEPGAISVLVFFLWGMRMVVRNALLKNNQASSTDGMWSISFQDNLARSIRKAFSLKYFREHLTVMRGGHLTIMDTGNEAEILVEDSRGVFGGQVGQDNIYEGAHVYGFGVVSGRFFDKLCEIEGI
jgi:hypothetical protein